ncbi:hypothetical protein [Roseomonas xinghualingensis]|uniref:hypothetical protein n=1 Tax=Roseomonas xinghualingensis TaxID=2986475 RepID=UPI0021F16F5E|nr:hypothetical protein [Roseomonas sp. SXEYE001]MCV4210025.1 hypothetical protein [Roseomonas sp. SXEYE001]
MSQWKVTDYGIEAADGTYHIPKARLHELRAGTDLYDWPLHMAEKEWVNMDQFLSAFCLALQRHRMDAYDPDRCIRSEAKARKDHAAAVAYMERVSKPGKLTF